MIIINTIIIVIFMITTKMSCIRVSGQVEKFVLLDAIVRGHPAGTGIRRGVVTLQYRQERQGILSFCMCVCVSGASSKRPEIIYVTSCKAKHAWYMNDDEWIITIIIIIIIIINIIIITINLMIVIIIIIINIIIIIIIIIIIKIIILLTIAMLLIIITIITIIIIIIIMLIVIVLFIIYNS